MSNAIPRTCPVSKHGLSLVQPGDGRVRYDCGSFYRPGPGMWIPDYPESPTESCTVESERLLAESVAAVKDAMLAYTLAFDNPLVPCDKCNAIGWHRPLPEAEEVADE